MRFPLPVKQILRRLEDAGFSAQAVGGCVRDSLRGVTPHDWDLCTSASPAEIKALFSDTRQILAGEKHGTVALVQEGEVYEVTSYRTESGYTDHRHPGAVAFVPSLEQDLARRDFTINAMACDGAGQLWDRFGGQADLAAGIVRCVGDPRRRFAEDALRILRALRFAAQLDFALDPETLAAARAEQEGLRAISAERVKAELDKLLLGPAAGRVLRDCPDILATVLPEIAPCIGFSHQNPYHIFNVWDHIAAATGASRLDLPDALLIRWALLLHDIGKPACFVLDSRGIGHTPGHQEPSARLARQVTARLKFPTRQAEEICALVRWHDDHADPTRSSALHWLNRLGSLRLVEAMAEVKRCDMGAHIHNDHMLRLEQARRDWLALARRAVAEGDCWQLSGLAVTGRDLVAAGVPAGPAVGRTLAILLEAVMDGACPNERAALLARAAGR